MKSDSAESQQSADLTSDSDSDSDSAPSTLPEATKAVESAVSEWEPAKKRQRQSSEERGIAEGKEEGPSRVGEDGAQNAVESRGGDDEREGELAARSSARSTAADSSQQGFRSTGKSSGPRMVQPFDYAAARAAAPGLNLSLDARNGPSQGNPSTISHCWACSTLHPPTCSHLERKACSPLYMC